MRVGFVDADMMWSARTNLRWGNSKADVFPNLAIMKMAAWHKSQGDEAEWYLPFNGVYDRVYVSKVFTSTNDPGFIIQADEVIYGGSGYCIHLDQDGKEYWEEPRGEFLQGRFQSVLPHDVEHMMPDYSMYPMVKDTAIGFLSRGCPRGCHFCHVEAKEGRKSYKVADLSEWWAGQKNIVLCDPNILACREWKDLLTQLADSKARVDINQGMDARLLTPEKMEYLNRIKLSTIHFAWDDYRQKDAVLRGLRCFAGNYVGKFQKGHQAQVFVLTNYDTTHEQDLERIYTLRDMGFDPYIMVYDKAHADPFYKSLQRWVNMRAIFHSIATFEEYDKHKAKE